MRDFNEADKKKKQKRIQIEENPGNLSKEQLSYLEERVKASLKDGYLSCPIAWKIADEANVPRIAVGNITDRLGLRVTSCQVGCFKVDKTVPQNIVPKNIDAAIIATMEALNETRELTCAKVIALAVQNKLASMDLADIANLRKWKIRQCQLGCF
jgi:hypothetical protein